MWGEFGRGTFPELFQWLLWGEARTIIDPDFTVS
jgi:hypothetical protein